MKKIKLLSLHVLLCVLGVTLFFVLMIQIQGCEPKEKKAEEQVSQKQADPVGNWSGKTKQGFPITLKIENVEGKIKVTQVGYNMEIKTQYGMAKKSTAKPEAISAEFIEGAFRYETPSLDVMFSGKSVGTFGFMAKVTITGELTSNSLITGSIQTLHFNPGAITATNDTNYTVTKQ